MKKYLLVLFMLLFLIGACSNEQDKTTPESNKEQIFKTQTEALEKANQVEQMLQSGADRNQKIIEEQLK